MNGMIAIVDFIGAAEPLNPAHVPFVSRPGATCRGCLFHGNRSAVCRAAGEEAARRAITDCENGVVYVAPVADNRQLKIEGV